MEVGGGGQWPVFTGTSSVIWDNCQMSSLVILNSLFSSDSKHCNEILTDKCHKTANTTPMPLQTLLPDVPLQWVEERAQDALPRVLGDAGEAVLPGRPPGGGEQAGVRHQQHSVPGETNVLSPGNGVISTTMFHYLLDLARTWLVSLSQSSRWTQSNILISPPGEHHPFSSWLHWACLSETKLLISWGHKHN